MAGKKKTHTAKNKSNSNRTRSEKGKSNKTRTNPRYTPKKGGGEGSRELRAPNAGDVARLLAGIGTPESSPFVPDDFQLEALEAIETEDVLVTAPTGSGKTWIAVEEIRRILSGSQRAWYTTPLKALTNSKYMEFLEEFGAEKVGILTGDRKENPHAPLIVGTTEIYRNQLFDSLRSGEQLDTDFVILDEAHYLSDHHRGHVWEEAIILSPPRIRLLLLSATIGNADEFAGWIEEVRGTTVRIVDRGNSRPVELRAGFISPDGELYPLVDKKGQLNDEIKQFEKRPRAARQGYRGRKRR